MGRRHIDRRAALGASSGQGKVGEIGVVAGTTGGLGHVQVQRFALWHGVDLLADL
jgi:hypothetical protein